MIEALDCSTNSPCQPLRKCIENSGDYAMQQMNHCPADKCQQNVLGYQPDSNLSSG